MRGLRQEPRWWLLRSVRVSSAEYLALPLRAHELLRDFLLYDVSAVDLPGGGTGRSIADIRKLESSAPPSRTATLIYGLRHVLGRMFGWDRAIRPDETLLPHLSEQDRRDSEVVPGTREAAFVVLYRFPCETLLETRNATVHGFMCHALASRSVGYRLYWGVYVRRVSWLTRPYLMAIEPFRRVLYPAMLRRIRRAWIAAYAHR